MEEGCEIGESSFWSTSELFIQWITAVRYVRSMSTPPKSKIWPFCDGTWPTSYRFTVS